MSHASRKFILSGVCAVTLAYGASTSAVNIQYQAADLPDVTLGDDLWQYTYTVSGSFVQFGGFNLLFDATLYGTLDNPPPVVNADWSVTTVEPDPGLFADGLFTATAVSAVPSLADPFTVSLVWHGVGAPGAQAFEVFNASFDTIETGQTSVVPLPGALALLFSGLGVLGAQVRHKRC